jgi:SRSO17 transposase
VYDGAVTRADLTVWESELEGLIARMRPLFYRTESRRHAEQYVRGLLAPIERKNGWTIAEHVGEPEPKALQRLLNLSPWDADALLKLNREYAMEHLTDPGAILVADPTGFPKKGAKSVGVQRQYSGTLGKYLAAPRLRYRIERVPGLRLGAHRLRGPRPPVPDPPIHR